MLVSTMRWLASLVVLCLLTGSAGSARPRVDLRAEVSGDVRMACADGLWRLVTPPELPRAEVGSPYLATDPSRSVTARGTMPSAPEQPLAALAIVPLAPSVVPPPRALVDLSLAPASELAPSPGRATSARGPPRMRSSLVSTASV